MQTLIRFLSLSEWGPMEHPAKPIVCHSYTFTYSSDLHEEVWNAIITVVAKNLLAKRTTEDHIFMHFHAFYFIINNIFLCMPDLWEVRKKSEYQVQKIYKRKAKFPNSISTELKQKNSWKPRGNRVYTDILLRFPSPIKFVNLQHM